MSSRTWASYIAEAPVETDGDMPIIDSGLVGRINITDIGGGPTGDVPPATTSVPGKVELNTEAETITGTDTTRATTAAGVKAAIDAATATLVPVITTRAQLVAAIAAASSGDVIDLRGNTITLSSAVTVDESITLRNGALTAGDHTALVVTAEGVTFDQLVVTRGSGLGGASGLDQQSNVVIDADRFLSLDCTYDGAYLACIYITNGTNWVTFRGGKFINESAVQDSSGIYAAAGSLGHRYITVDGAEVDGDGCVHGIILFDTSDSTIANLNAHGLRILPTVTLTGWAVVSGNVYRTLDRTDGQTRVLKDNGTQRTENTSTPTAPGSNQWGISGGYVYLNLGGTDPSSRTITSGIVSGYGIAIYNTGAGAETSRNDIAGAIIDDCDGFGIYLQLGTNSDTSLDNKIRGCTLTNVCLEGLQHSSLPFAGVGVIGGLTTVISDTTVRVSGSSGKVAPSFAVSSGGGASLSSGEIINCASLDSTQRGFDVFAKSWALTSCRVERAASAGFRLTTLSASEDNTARLNGCSAFDGASSGVEVAQVASSTMRAHINGGEFSENDVRGISVAACTEFSCVGAKFRENGVTTHYALTLTNTVLADIVGNVFAHSNSAGKAALIQNTNTDVTFAANTTSAVMTAPYSFGLPVRISGGRGMPSGFLGTATPEAAVTAPVGSTFHRTDGGAATSFYVKESGTGNTGWVAK